MEVQSFDANVVATDVSGEERNEKEWSSGSSTVDGMSVHVSGLKRQVGASCH